MLLKLCRCDLREIHRNNIRLSRIRSSEKPIIYIIFLFPFVSAALAFCDWSQLQKTRRELLRAHTFPNATSNMYDRLDKCLKTELAELTDTIGALPDTGCVDLKNLLLHSCANTFMSYFCSTRFSSTYDRFREFVRNFDDVFYEVNQGSAGDFLPSLTPFYRWHFKKIRTWSSKIRNFMETEIFNKRKAAWVPGTKPVDFVDNLLEAVTQPDRDDGFDLDIGLFSLEDIIGGHSAITNFIVKTLGFLVDRPDVQRRIQEEADAVVRASGYVGLADRSQMPYTEAVVFESLRLIASPIVPHLANRDTSVDGKSQRLQPLIGIRPNNINIRLLTIIVLALQA